MTTTAEYRNASLAAAKLCNWHEAADLLEKAIEVYPSGLMRNTWAQLDVSKMRDLLASYRASAKDL